MMGEDERERDLRLAIFVLQMTRKCSDTVFDLNASTTSLIILEYSFMKICIKASLPSFESNESFLSLGYS